MTVPEERVLMVSIHSSLFKLKTQEITLVCSSETPMPSHLFWSTLTMVRVPWVTLLLVVNLRSISSFTDLPSQSFHNTNQCLASQTYHLSGPSVGNKPPGNILTNQWLRMLLTSTTKTACPLRLCTWISLIWINTRTSLLTLWVSPQFKALPRDCTMLTRDL